MTYEIHPAANEIPMMDAKRFADLKRDIAENGLREPIKLFGGKLIDGRNRYKACQELGIEPATLTVEGDPWKYVWSLNGARRDLVDEQRYLIWKRLEEKSAEFQAEQRRITEEANRKRSETQKGVPKAEAKERAATECCSTFNQHKSQNAKVAASKTNAGAVARGDKLAKERPDLAEKVRNGTMKPAEAHRQMQKDAVAGKASALPKGKYRVIYADPPWKYNDAQAVKGAFGTGTGAADGHYPTLSMSELKALPVDELAADDAVLFLWVTSPLLYEAEPVFRAWGFTYKAAFIWDKVKHNMGHYNSVRHEFLLVCTKGRATPDNVKLFDSVQSIERSSKHSEKPEEFRSIIDTLYPNGSRIELFRRGSAPKGWKVWGNEA